MANSGLGHYCNTIVMDVFSTITSPAFSELVVVLSGDAMAGLPMEVALLETLRKMNEIRPFELVFLLEVPQRNQEEARQKLAEVLDSVTAKFSFDFLGSPPTTRTAQPSHYARDFHSFY